jgi:hypothetical protein
MTISRKKMLIPISAGTTAIELEAKVRPLFNAIKTYATIIVDGSVPRIPPTFVPNFSATTVINITTKADIKKGIIV